MATIRMREHIDGSVGYQAVVRIKKKGKIVYRESRTFSLRRSAVDWGKRREVELRDPVVLSRAQAGKKPLAVLIRWYIDKFQAISQWQRSKQNSLEFLEAHEIGQEDVYKLTASRLVKHIRARRNDGAGPATVGIDLTYIGVVLETAKAVEQLSIDPLVVEQARESCRRLGLIAAPNHREVRPTDSQLVALTNHFMNRSPRATIPMANVMWFAIYSSRREDEICRLRWADNDPETRTGLVRDLKDPDRKIGNHRRFRYAQEAWDIVQRQPKTSEFIFPYKAVSIKEAFRRACLLLGIDDLHFHDLRHEATSRLFERGYEIHEVAQFTLHSSWQNLKRYTHLKPEQLIELPATPASKGDSPERPPLKAQKATEISQISGAVGRSVRPNRPRL